MKRLIGVALAMALALAVLTAASVAAGDASAASGSGHAVVGGELRTFTFTVKTMADGSVKGQSELINRSDGSRAHRSLDCLDIDGDRAFVGGVVTTSDVPTLVGTRWVFLVEDNGEGARAMPDRISLALGTNDPCTNPGLQALLVTMLFDIERGNVQVR